MDLQIFCSRRKTRQGGVCAALNHVDIYLGSLVFLFLKEGKERGSVCSFESCMWLSREPGYGGIIFGKQILAE